METKQMSTSNIRLGVTVNVSKILLCVRDALLERIWKT